MTVEEDKREEVVEQNTIADSSAFREPNVYVRERTAAPYEPVVSASVPERRESVVKRRTTNTSGIVAMIIGVIILFLGVFLVLTRVLPFLPYPWSLLAVLVVGIIFIVVGATLIIPRTRVA